MGDVFIVAEKVINMRWYVVGAPWLQPGLMPYIVAGNEDPHAGIPVADLIDVEEWDSSVDLDDDPFELAGHIVRLHNDWLDKRQSTEDKG